MEDDFETGDMFKDPEGFYEEEKPPTFSEHQMLCGTTVRVRLVGSHPLYVWALPPSVNKSHDLPLNGKAESADILRSMMTGQPAVECWADELPLY